MLSDSKKVAIIGTVGLPACYGGFETLTAYLVKHLHEQHELTVYCSGKAYPSAERRSHYEGAKLVYLPLQANGAQSILYDCLSILHAVFYADVLLVLGVPGAFLLPFVKWFTNKKIIVSIDGIEWRRAKWNRYAKWFLRWSENLAVKYSHADISDNDAIQDYTARAYHTRSRVIEYGGDHARRQPITDADRVEHPFLTRPYAFKVCRIEPENNVHLVLRAFAELPSYVFVIVGNWNNSAYGRELRTEFGHSQYANLHLLDPIYDQARLDVLRSNCAVYVHGHSAGGTNPSLVEAMSLGLPVLAFHASFNKATTEHKAVYFATKEELMQCIKTTSMRTWLVQGQAMQSVADRRYNWALIARKYNYLIQKVSATERQSTKGGLHSQLSQLPPAELVQHQLGQYAALKMFYEQEV
jgi:glycosyltransferase involved in cell wall biosynthesis